MLPDNLWSVDSSRAGGKFTIPPRRFEMIGRLSDDKKVLITSWLVGQRALGDPVPNISDSLEIDSIRSPSVWQRAERLLKYINSQLTSISDIFVYPKREPNLLMEREMWRCYAEMLAWSASTKIDELDYLIEFLDRQGLIGPPPPGYVSPNLIRILTVEGHTYLAELGNRTTDSTQAFVAMWFDNETEDAFYKGIERGIEDSGYSPRRIDKKEHLNKIDDEIIAEIRRSKFLVVDLTEGEPVTRKDAPTMGGTRGSVYYEAGFARGLGVPVIYTCRGDLHHRVHFDIRQYSCIFWDTPEDLRARLSKRISARFGDGPVSFTKSDSGDASGVVQDETGRIT